MTRWANSAGRGFDMASRFGFDAAYEEHERGTLDVAGYFEALRRGLSVDLADDELLEGWNDIYVGVNEEICPVLAAARARFPLYALTNSNPSHHAVWSERFADVLEVFTATFVSSDIGHRKPDRAAFDTVTSMIGVSPSSILFFDDTFENVTGARSAGMQAVHVTSTETVRTALAQLGVRARLAEQVDERNQPDDVDRLRTVASICPPRAPGRCRPVPRSRR